MKYAITVTYDGGADYIPQTIVRHNSLENVQALVEFSILSFCGASDAEFIAAEMRGIMLKRTATSWGYESRLKTLRIRVEKLAR